MLQTRINGKVFRDTLANFMASTRKWKLGDMLMPSDSPEIRFGNNTDVFEDLATVPFTELQQAEFVAAMGTTTNLTAVPASFADEAAVQAYLVTLRANVESRLDAIEAKVDATLTALVDAELMEAS